MSDYIIFKDHAGQLHIEEYDVNVSVNELRHIALAHIGSAQHQCSRYRIFNYDSIWNDWYALNNADSLRIVEPDTIPDEILLAAVLLRK